MFTSGISFAAIFTGIPKLSFRKNLYRDSGIIGRLKRDLNFDIKRFDKSQYGSEICKILYYVYEMENDKVPELRGSKRFELPEFLTKSSKNLGKYSFPGQGNYGWRVQRDKTMWLIEHTLEKELDIQSLTNIRNEINDVITKWYKMNLYVITLMEKCALYREPLPEIEKIRERINQVSNKLDESVNIEDFSTSPIATLYFLIYQHRNLCEIEDNVKVCDLLREMSYKILESPGYDIDIKDLYYSTIPLDDVEDFIKSESDLLVACIYAGVELSDEEWTRRRRNICYRKGQVHRLLNLLATEIPLDNGISILHILGCLQLLLSNECNETDESNVDDIKKQKRNRIIGILRNDNEYILGPDKMYWMKIIDNHIYRNTGRNDVQSKYMDFLLIYYNIRRKIHSAKNITEMQNIHKIYYEELTDFLFSSV